MADISRLGDPHRDYTAHMKGYNMTLNESPYDDHQIINYGSNISAEKLNIINLLEFHFLLHTGCLKHNMNHPFFNLKRNTWIALCSAIQTSGIWSPQSSVSTSSMCYLEGNPT